MVAARFLVPPTPTQPLPSGGGFFFTWANRYESRAEETMHKPEKIKELRGKMIQHLDAAQALADETQDSMTGYLIERALDSARADQWPALDARFDARPKT